MTRGHSYSAAVFIDVPEGEVRQRVAEEIVRSYAYDTCSRRTER